MIRTKHWIFPAANFNYPSVLKWIFKYIPGALRLHRLHIFLSAESDFRLFPMTKAAARLRAKRKVAVEKYMRRTAPARYHDLLIPEFDVGCKVLSLPFLPYHANLIATNIRLWLPEIASL